MNRLRAIRTFAALPMARKRLALAAVVRLVQASLATRLLPIRWVSRHYGRLRDQGFEVPLHDRVEEARAIGRMVETVAARMPGRPACLPQAVAVKWMLDRRGITSALIIGARPARRADGSLDAHAWVRIGHRIVIGGSRSKTYQVLSVFA